MVTNGLMKMPVVPVATAVSTVEVGFAAVTDAGPFDTLAALALIVKPPVKFVQVVAEPVKFVGCVERTTSLKPTLADGS